MTMRVGLINQTGKNDWFIGVKVTQIEDIFIRNYIETEIVPNLTKLYSLLTGYFYIC